MAADNRLLDEFNLEGIPSAPRGVPQIEVKFDIDANGILNVSARDVGTGKEHKVQVKQSGGLSTEEIERMKRDAEMHAEDDKQKRELAEARNQAESHCFETEKLVKEHGDKLTDSDKSAIDAAIQKCRTTAAGNDPKAIKSAVDALQQATHALSKAMYDRAGAAGAAAGNSSGGSSKKSQDDDAIDAEFEVKK